MSDLTALQHRRDQRFFAQWDEFLSSDLVTQSEASVRQLIDNLIALGPSPTHEQVQAEIDGCVRCFNDLDTIRADGWIYTIERDDISEVLLGLVDLCGFDGDDEEWLHERDW